MTVNRVTLIGRIGKDPELRYLPNSDAVCNFSLATSEQWKDKATGEKKEQTEWHRCSAFGKLGEICGQYLRKGSLAYVEGRIQTRKWQDKDGQDRYTTEIKVDNMKMLGRREGMGDSGPRDSGERIESGGSRPASNPQSESGGGCNDFEDDIPF